MRRGTRRSRDPELLDLLDARPRTVFEGAAWRVVREGRDALDPSAGNGRWDMQAFNVLYTSLDLDGAIAEIEYHLAMQPVFPSRLSSVVQELRVHLSSVIRFDTLEALASCGITTSEYSKPLCARTREIGDAAAFLGCDALIAPSARWNCLNLVCFTDSMKEQPETISNPIPINWAQWRSGHPIKYRRS
jgi:RES domain